MYDMAKIFQRMENQPSNRNENRPKPQGTISTNNKVECKSCYRYNNDDHEFCNYCGTKLLTKI